MPAPIVLTIAGSDPSGGAGIQADLKTFAAFGVYGAAVVTALTAQDTTGVRAIADVEPRFVGEQLNAVLTDLPVVAAKTGMLHRVGIVDTVAEQLAARAPATLVVDPVMVATSGTVLLEPDGIALLRTRLLPLATVVTPNLREAEVLTARRVSNIDEMRDAARALVDFGARAAHLTGGHATGEATDILFDGRSFHTLSAARVPGTAPHGTGCTLSAALTAALARGRSLEAALHLAKHYVTHAITQATTPGRGAPLLNHDIPIG